MIAVSPTRPGPNYALIRLSVVISDTVPVSTRSFTILRYAKTLLAICRPSGCTVVSGIVVVVVVGVCNHSQMRTSKCTCLIFGVNIGLDAG